MLWQSCSTVQFHLCQKLTKQFCDRILSNYTYESPMKRSAKGEAESHSSAFTKRRHMLQVKYKSLKVTSRIILPWQDLLKLHRNGSRPSSNCHMQLHLVDLHLVDIHTFQLKSLFAWSMWEQNKRGMEKSLPISVRAGCRTSLNDIFTIWPMPVSYSFYAAWSSNFFLQF